MKKERRHRGYDYLLLNRNFWLKHFAGQVNKSVDFCGFQ